MDSHFAGGGGAQRRAGVGGTLGVGTNGDNSQGRRQQGSRSGGKHQTVLDQLSLLKMSPGSSAACLGMFSCKDRFRTLGRAPRASLAPVTLRLDASAPHREDRAPPMSAFVPDY